MKQPDFTLTIGRSAVEALISRFSSFVTRLTSERKLKDGTILTAGSYLAKGPFGMMEASLNYDEATSVLSVTVIKGNSEEMRKMVAEAMESASK